MKKILGLFTIVTLAVSLMWFGAAQAIDTRGGSAVRVAEDEVVDSSLYMVGQELSVLGTVEGDLFCAGQYVKISGVVQGDVICAAQTIEVTGSVEGSIRAAAQIVTVNSHVDSSMTLAAMTVDVQEDSVIARDVTIFGQEINLSGSLGRDALVMGDIVNDNAQIGRDFETTANDVTLTSSAVVGRNLVYTSEMDAAINSDAEIVGTTEHKYPEKTAKADKDQFAFIESVFTDFASYLLVGLVLLLAVPRTFEATNKVFKHHPVASFFTGFVGLILVPVSGIVLLVSFFGAVLGVAALLAWVVSLMVGLVYASYAVGGFVVEKAKWQAGAWDIYVKFVVGLVLLTIVGLIPVIGSLAVMVSVVWAVGALWYAIFKGRTMSSKTSDGGNVKPKVKQKAKELDKE